MILAWSGWAYAASINSCVECHSSVLLSHKFISHAPISLQDCVACHRGNPLTRRKNLAHFHKIDAAYAWFRMPDAAMMSSARQAIDRFACRRCHIQDRKGNALATDLDQLLTQRSIAEIKDALLEPAYYMPNFALGESDLQLVILALLAGGVEAKTGRDELPTVVHFEDPGSDEQPFVKHCGPCHRVLTSQWGGLGTQTVAPNLSGLLTPFYLKNFKDGQRWSADGLTRWIKNPRQIRPMAVMPPLNLEDQKIRQLIENTWTVTQGELQE